MASHCGPSICSHSLGRAWLHDLPGKLTAAAAAGFVAIEIFFEDLEYHAAALYHVSVPTLEQEIVAAEDIRSMCEYVGLQIVCLQPLRNVEGRLEPTARDALTDEVSRAVALAHALGTDLIGIASSLLPASETTGDPTRLAADLAAIAIIGAAANPPVRFTYEALCFGTHVRTWQQSRDIVRQAARPNLGLCIDTFNLAGWDYADPLAAGHVRPDGSARLKESLRELRTTVKASEIFFVQVVDAERYAKPLNELHPLHVRDQPARMTWSRASRLFYGEADKGAFMPVHDILEALINGVGWRGWLSMEFFNRSLEGASVTVPAEHATRGISCWKKMLKDVPQIMDPRPAAEEPSRKTKVDLMNQRSDQVQCKLALMEQRTPIRVSRI